MKKTVVIFYSKGYSDQVAIALKEYYATKPMDVSAVLIDENDYSNFNWAKISKSFYKFSARNTPIFNKLFGYFQNRHYESRIRKSFKEENEGVEKQEIQIDPDANANANKSSTISNLRLRARQMDVIIKRFSPDAIICTTGNSLKRVLVARARVGYDVKVFSAISDYYANKGFIMKGVDKYLVANQATKQALQVYRIPDEDIEVLGTPTRKVVDKIYKKEEVLSELNIEEKEIPCILLAAGRYGASGIKTVAKDVLPFATKANIIVLADKSTSVHTFIEQLSKSLKINKNVYIIDSIDDIAKLYSISDCVVCAPTAYMTYEVIARRIPCILSTPLDFREKGNFEYLTQNGLALAGIDSERLVAGINSILAKDEDYKEFVDFIKYKFPLTDVKNYADFILSQVKPRERKIESLDEVNIPVATNNEVNESKKKKEDKSKKKDKK